jgi:hypothetical protein
VSVSAPIRGGGFVTVSGVGESGTGTGAYGIALTDLGRIVAPVISLIADSIDVPSGALVDAGAGAVVLKPLITGTLIDLGGPDVLTGTPLTLGLSAAELGRIQAGTLTIGAADSGELRITAPLVRAAATDVTLVSGAGIVFDSGSIDTDGGTLVFDPGTAVQPLTAGTDVAAGSISFADGAALAIRIDGTEVDTGYSQLNVAGKVDLRGAALEISGSHVPALGDRFTIVNNTGSDPVVGTFTGLPEGAVIANFLGSGLVARITYVGGDGNDVVLELIQVTRIDMTIVHQPSATGDNGEVGTLPLSASWVHEWQSFWVEIWVSTPDTTTVSLTQATVNLQYHTDYLTAQEIQYGPAFTEDRTGTIDDTAGRYHQIGGRTLQTGLAQDDYVLLARVRFVSSGDDQVPVDKAGRNIGPYAMQIALSGGQSVLVGGGVVEPQLGQSPDTELWAVVYDIDDNNLIDFGDFSFFAAAFGRTAGDSVSEPPYAWWADFDKSGKVDFGDLAFFAPNFNKSRNAVQSGSQTLIFPPGFPDSWRPMSGGGEAEGESGSEGESEGEGEAAWQPSKGSVRVAASSGGSQHAVALPWQLARAVDEAHAALQTEPTQGLPWWIATEHEAQPALPLWQESLGSLYSRNDEPGATLDERPDRHLDDWEPLEDLLTTLAVS